MKNRTFAFKLKGGASP